MTVKILGQASEIQFQGTRDLTQGNAVPPLTVGLFVGRFRRGSDKPMVVTLDNVKAKLGYDQNNFDYRAVVDALNEGVPSVYVMNVGSSSCDATTHVVKDEVVSEGVQLALSFVVNGETFRQGRNIALDTDAIDIILDFLADFNVNFYSYIPFNESASFDYLERSIFGFSPEQHNGDPLSVLVASNFELIPTAELDVGEVDALSLFEGYDPENQSILLFHSCVSNRKTGA